MFCPSLWLFTRAQHFTRDPVFTRCSAALETRTFKLETATSRLDRDPVALLEPLALYLPAGLYTLNSDSVALPAALLHRTALQRIEPHRRCIERPKDMNSSSAAIFCARILSYKNKVVPLQAESIISRYCENNIGSPRRRPSSAARYLLTGTTSLIFIPRM